MTEQQSPTAGKTDATTGANDGELGVAGANGEMGDFYMEDGVMKKHDGYNWIVAGLFIVSGMVGGGVVALPTSIMKASFYFGLMLMCGMAALATIAATLLGKAWVVMLRMYPVYRTHCRRPYPEMGYRAMGERMRMVVSVVMSMTQFGVAVTFLLIISKTSAALLHSIIGVVVSDCLVIVAMAFILLPFTFQKSPKELLVVVLLGMFSTIIAIVLIVVGASMDCKCAEVAEFPPFSGKRSVLALGVLMFTYGGHALFPTIQNDMRVPSEFSKSAVLAFILVTLMNMSVVFVSGYVYGDSLLEDGVMMSIQTVGIQRAINLFITIHCFLVFPLMVNPIYQEIESFFGISMGFDLRRYFLRCFMMVVIVFTALTIPNFGHFMGLIGGSLVVLSVMVLPAFFYILLSTREKVQAARQLEQNNDGKSTGAPISTEINLTEVLTRTDPFLLVVCAVMFIVGLAACIISTTTAMLKILSLQGDALMPCYLRFFYAPAAVNTTLNGLYNCCGHMQQMSLNGDSSQCTVADLNFYFD